MSDASEKSPAPVVCVVEGGRSTTTPTKRRCINRLCVVGAAMSVVVVAMIIVCVLVAIKLTGDTDSETLKIHRTLKSGKAMLDEEYYQQRDSGNWLLKYHVTDPDSETWALAEFDKGVQILKLQLKLGDYACFIIRQPVMNGTAVADKIRLSTADKADSSEIVDTPNNVTSVRFKIAIISGDVSALIGGVGQSFCAGLPIYAALPVPDSAPQEADSSTDNVDDGRQRRQAFFYYCYWSIINCLIVRFSDSPWGFYYGCPPICVRFFY